ncbi:MAG: hypothetical protein ACLFP4_09025 [Spirochaetales bacterium]
MRRLTIALLLVLVGSSLAIAQEDSWVNEDAPLMAPADIGVTAAAGVGLLFGAIDVAGGVEVMLGQFEIEDLPLTYGIAGRFRYLRERTTVDRSNHRTYLGGAGFATLHASFRGFEIEPEFAWIQRFDVYAGIGAGFYQVEDTERDALGLEYDTFQVGLRTAGGVNYFVAENIALVFEGGYYGRFGGGLLGVLFKL